MDATKLVIGNKNYSSWSLRGWLAVKQAGVDFEEVFVNLGDADFKDQLRRQSKAAKVPVLIHGGHEVWDTLAIIEYLAETFPDADLWPEDRRERARARSIAAEMHSSFTALRSAMPMNIRRSLPASAADRVSTRTSGALRRSGEAAGRRRPAAVTFFSGLGVPSMRCSRQWPAGSAPMPSTSWMSHRSAMPKRCWVQPGSRNGRPKR